MISQALEIIWNEKEKYSGFIVLIGAFHTICAYFNVLRKKIDGSGFNEVVLESGIFTSGSINGITKGKHYSRAFRVHLAVCEVSEDGINMLTDDIKKFPTNLHDDPSKEFLDLSLKDASFIHLFYA